ncbi:MAG: hypothetical protein J07HX64_00220 [halophilic archaeon J07HX64]|jgi:hypothetical protein|nr:MAG: hypothetical protein J07HX64_00220 [halophilic archaeon J07HX64]
MATTDSASGFSVTWVLVALAVGATLQAIGWVIDISIFTGLPAYFLVGLLTAWGSPGDTLAEPGVAAFLMVVAGFIIDNFLLTVLVVGIPLAAAYGVAGLLAALLGAFLGERFLDTS